MGALEGLTVLDLSRILAGPFCTQMLSDLGATVWKVEPPWGDDTRQWGPPFTKGESSYYLSANRGKKSLSINLKDRRGQDLVRAMARKSDVVVENYRPGDLARYRLDYDNLARINPRVIYVSITAFGQTGPRASEPGVDAALQAMTGIMSVTGDPNGPPARVGVAWIDVMTGLTASTGILAALRSRDTSGLGQHIDLSLFDTGLMSMVNVGQGFLTTRESPQRYGSAHPQIVPYQAFEARDGWFVLAVINDRQYQSMCDAIGMPELWNDPRFQSNAGRVRNRQCLVSRLTEVFRLRTKQEWLTALCGTRVPASPIYDLAEAMSDPQSESRQVLWDLEHPKLGQLPLLANALQHMDTPASPQNPPPLLGEHTAEILKTVLGTSDAEVEHLQENDVIVCAPTAHQI